MVYLLDANVLIDANRDYYPIDRVPQFWQWLETKAKAGDVHVPLEIHEEVSDSEDALATWACLETVKSVLILNEEPDAELVKRVIAEGYAGNLTDVEIEELGRDPFLIAYALAAPDARCVVTTEVSKPKRIRANRHIPDVCKSLGVQCCNTYKFLRQLDFRTDV